jgi:hypothetical protein
MSVRGAGGDRWKHQRSGEIRLLKMDVKCECELVADQAQRRGREFMFRFTNKLWGTERGGLSEDAGGCTLCMGVNQQRWATWIRKDIY